MKVDFEKLIRKVKDQGEDSVLVRPGVTASFYSAIPIHPLAPALAQVLEEYLAFIPPGTLKSYYARSGYYKELSPAIIQKDLKSLKALPKSMAGYVMEYSEGLDGDVGTHAFHFEGTKLDDENTEEETNHLRIEFPPEAPETIGIDKFIAFLEKIATIFPAQSGNAGYAFKRSKIDEDPTGKEILKLLPRYIGFDPSYFMQRYSMCDHIFTAHWLNFLDESLVKKLGGIEKIRAALPKAEVKKLGTGAVLRASQVPPVGDVNRKAPDLGQVPEVARLLSPLRIEMEEFEEDVSVFDASKWLARFDKLKSQDWKNA